MRPYDQAAIDWEELMFSLQRAGLSVREIGRRTGIRPGTLAHYRAGRAGPRYENGARLLELAMAVRATAVNSLNR